MARVQREEGGASQVLRGLQRGFDRYLAVSITLGSIWIAGLVTVVVLDVGGRILFDRPLEGAFEITTFSIIGIVYLQLAHTIRSNRMTRSDLLTVVLAERAPGLLRIIEGAFLLLCSAVFILLTVFVTDRTLAAFRDGVFYGSTGAVRFPSWPIYLVATLGCASSALQYLMLAAFRVAKVDPDQTPQATGE